MNIFWIIGFLVAGFSELVGPAFGKHDGIDLTCSGDSMLIKLDKNRLFSDPVLPSDHVTAHLIDRSCRADDINGADAITIATAYNNCGTEKEVWDMSIVYSNRVYIASSSGESNDILIECEIPRRDFTIGIMSSGINRLSLSSADDSDSNYTVINTTRVGYGAFYVVMQRFTDNNFTTSFPVSDSGAELGLNEDLFFEVELKNVAELKLNLESCWATVKPDSNSKPQYEFISKGCDIDGTVLFYNTSSSPAKRRFSFRSFAFNGHEAQVYLHCKVFICDDTDVTKDCNPSCDGRRRRRRSVEKGDAITRDMRSYRLQFKHIQ